MGLGNNRDYKSRDRQYRRMSSVANARTAELVAGGMAPLLATTTAMREVLDGKLNKELKAWVDPILTHSRLMRFLNHLDQGELYVVIQKDAPGWPGWTWTIEGYDDKVVRSVDLTSYKTKKALIAVLEASDTYRSFKRYEKP